MALAKTDKFAGDDSLALVDELVKGVLAICAGFAPNDWARVIIDGFALAVNALAVAFHVELL